jgi:hypothetical protein
MSKAANVFSHGDTSCATSVHGTFPTCQGELTMSATRGRKKSTAQGKITKPHHSTLSNVRVAVMVWPVRENVSGAVVIVRFVPLISK